MDGQPEYTRAFLHTRDIFDRDSNNISAGQWVIDCTMYAGGSFCEHTTIRTPSALLTYTYGDLAIPNPTTVIEGPVGLKHVKVQDPTGANTFEDEDLTYTELAVVGSTYRTVEVSQRSLQRNTAVYTTTVTYGDFRLPSHIFESGDVSRTTERTYETATSTPYLAGLLASESIAVGSEAVHRNFSHDSQGFTTSATEPGVANNLQMSFTRDDGGNIASVTRRGLTTSYTYSHGSVETISTPLTSIVRSINLDGTVASESKGGRTTTFGYDLLSRVTSVQPPSGNPTITEYDGAGTWIRTTRGASVVKATLDGFGRPTLIEKGAGAEIVKTRTEYDAEGRVVYEGYPFSGSADRGTRIEYDALGRVTRRINPSIDPNNPTFSTRTYDPAGVVIITDENGHHTTQTWDAFGDPDDARLLSVLDADNKLWAYEYHVLGELASVTAVGGVTRTWAYNDQHLLSSETHPESGTTTYGYDAQGRLTQKTDANAVTTTYAYDANNRIKTITAGSRVTAIGYEADSDNRGSASTAAVGTTLLYDNAGRLRLRQDAIDGKLFDSKYEYDADDNLRAIVYPSGRRIEYDYDGEHQITRVFETATGRDYAIGMTYQASGALATMLTNNGTSTTTLTYDPQRYWPAMITSGPLNLTYSNYDGVGNVGAITDSFFGNQSFTYDVLDRLTMATGSYGSIAYAYDAHGNRQTNANGTYEINPTTLRLTAQGGISFAYDNNGNVLSHGPANYTYTPQNMMETATVVGGTATYTYDGDDWRVKRSFGGSTSYYLRGPNGQLLEEWKDPATSTGLIRDYIYAGSRLLSRVDKSTTLDPNNNCGVIAIGGAPVSVSAVVDQNPCLRFDGITGQRVSTVVNNNSVSTSYLSFLRPNQTEQFGSILYGLPFGNPNGFIEPQTLDSSGIYTLAIDPWFSNTGSMTLTLVNVPPDAIVPITPGGPSKSVTTTVSGQNGRLTFTGTAGQRVSALWYGDTIPTGWFSLLKPDGSSLFSTLLWGGNYGFMEPQTLPVTGTYTLLIDPSGTNTGSATAWLYDVPPDVLTPITPGGSPVTVTLTAPGQNARLTFTGTADQRVAVTSNNNTIPVSLFALVKPDGSNLFYGDMYGGQNGFMDTKTLPVSGTYTLLADPAWTNTGTVTFTLYDVPPDFTGSVAADGVPVTVTTTSLGQNARLTFNGTAGQRVSVTSSNNNIPVSTFSLVKPDGWNLLSGDMWGGGNGFMDVQTLPTTGTYSLFVDPWWGHTGSVTLRLYDVADLTSSVTIGGASTTLTVSTPG